MALADRAARPTHSVSSVWSRGTVQDGMTTREKLHIVVDELTDGEAEAALARLSRERELLRQWTASTDTGAAEDE
jgi:hypothetical protein